MSKTSELAHLFRALKAPAAARALPALGRAGARGGVELRAVRRDPARHRGRRPRQPRRREPDQGRPVPGPQDAGGVRLQLPALGQEDRDRAPRPARLPARPRERAPARPARHRQDPPRDRARRSAPASPASASSSRPRPNGSPASPTPNARAASRPNCAGSSFIPLIVVDEVGYIPFDPEAANLMFSARLCRYERASMIVTSNKPFSAWGEIFGDDIVATAMIDRLIHHAEILALKGDSYRLRGKDLDARPAPNPPKTPDRSPTRPRRSPQTASQRLDLEPDPARRRARGRKPGSALRASPSSRPRRT